MEPYRINRRELSDELLLQNYVQGDDRAFETLLIRHKDFVYTYIQSFIKDEDLSNDIFQETFIKVINSLRTDSYRDNGKFRYWVLRIAHNLIIDTVRNKKFNIDITDEDDSYLIFNHADILDDSIEDRMIAEQKEKELMIVIDLLPEKQREVVRMHYFEDLSFKEIAEKTGVSINTSLGRMHYAIQNMRKMMQ